MTTDDVLSAWIDAHLAGYGAVWGEAFAATGYVLVARHGVPFFQRACGLADRARSIAPDESTRFRIGSVTKQMTAVAVLQLVEAGRLDLEAPFRETVPEYPAGAGGEVTIRHLLTHTSGIPSFTEELDDTTWSASRRTNAEVLARVKDKPAHFAAGTAFRYSNTRSWATTGPRTTAGGRWRSRFRPRSRRAPRTSRYGPTVHVSSSTCTLGFVVPYVR